MRILEHCGSRFIPAFGSSGERMPDFDLYVALGARHDPRQGHPGPRQIVVPALSSMPAVAPNLTDPTEVRISQWVFDFVKRDFEGQPTLTVTMRAEGEATPFESMENDERWGQFFFDLTRMYARLCRDQSNQH